MNITTSRTVVAIATDTIGKIIQKKQNNGSWFGNMPEWIIAYASSILPGVGKDDLKCNLHPIEYLIETDPNNGKPYSELKLSGTIEVVEGVSKGQKISFCISPKVEAIIRYTNQVIPFVTFNYTGYIKVEGPMSIDLVQTMLTKMEFQERLYQFRIFFIHELMNTLKSILNLNPSTYYSDFAVKCKLLRATDTTQSAIALFVDIPGADIQGISEFSMLPFQTEMLIHINNLFLNDMATRAIDDLRINLERAAKENESTIEVSNLNIKVEFDHFYIKADIRETDLDISGNIQGNAYLVFEPGRFGFALNLKELDLNINLPWWAKFVVNVMKMDTRIKHIYPNIAQIYAQQLLSNAITEMNNSLWNQNLGLPGTSGLFPNTVEMKNGAITMYIQVLVEPFEDVLVRADYSRLRRKFVRFHLRSGRQYNVSDLAKLMHDKIITIPGYHSVNKTYIRSNNDNTLDNNLSHLFGFGGRKN